LPGRDGHELRGPADETNAFARFTPPPRATTNPTDAMPDRIVDLRKYGAEPDRLGDNGRHATPGHASGRADAGEAGQEHP
jgi:hypothetical protein